jgi:hypothetical protein
MFTLADSRASAVPLQLHKVISTAATRAGRIAAVAKRTGYLSSWLFNGKRLLELPDCPLEPVDPDISEADIVARFALDEVVRVPHVELPPLCGGLCVDGPLAGRRLDYQVNRLGAVGGCSTGGWAHRYQVVKLANDEQPAELRHLESRPWRQQEGSGSPTQASSADDSGQD